jgi:hypothetical protein
VVILAGQHPAQLELLQLMGEGAEVRLDLGSGAGVIGLD